MKKIWLFMMLFLCTTCCVTITSISLGQKTRIMQRELKDEVLRFHVRANSDETVDQDIKMKVKHAVIEYLRPIMEKQKTILEAKEEMLCQLPQIKQVAEQALNGGLHEKNETFGISVQLKEEYFPEKRYGDFTFPEGTYDAVVISLGEGKGQNWWCMLYPGLCFVNESYAVVSEESGEKLEKVLSEDTFAWISQPERRKWGFRWLDFEKWTFSPWNIDK